MAASILFSCVLLDYYVRLGEEEVGGFMGTSGDFWGITTSPHKFSPQKYSSETMDPPPPSRALLQPSHLESGSGGSGKSFTNVSEFSEAP